ncbi:MAG: hypothetical protein ACKO2X_08395, partial [Bacteroidota bacterium]
LPNPWTSGTLPARLEVLYRELGPCGGFGGVARPCLEQGTPSGQPIPMWLSANPPLTGWLQMQATYGQFSGFGLGDWLAQESRLSISGGQPATLDPVLLGSGDVDGSGY